MQHGSTFCFCSKDRDLSSNHVLSLSLSLLLPSAHPFSLLFYRSLSVSPVRLVFSSAPPFHFTFPFSFQLLSFPLSTVAVCAACSFSLPFILRKAVRPLAVPKETPKPGGRRRAGSRGKETPSTMGYTSCPRSYFHMPAQCTGPSRGIVIQIVAYSTTMLRRGCTAYELVA